MLPIRDDSRSVNVEWFRGPGVTDAQKIQRAIDELRPDGGTVWAPRKIYGVDEVLQIGGAGTYQQGLEFRAEGGGVAVGLAWTGAAGAPAIMEVRNSHYGAIRNVAFYGNAKARQGLWIRHVAGDPGIVQMFEIEKCWFADGQNYNVLIGEEDGGSNAGDCGPLLFRQCYFQPSNTAPPTTIAHVRQRAQDTFGTSFQSCRFTAQGGTPTKGFSIQGGTAHFYGTLGEIFDDALFYIDAAAGIPIASIGAWGIEFQGGSMGQLLRTNTAGAGAAAALRATVLSQVMGDDIVAPLSPTTITWDINEVGSLVLSGVHAQADIEIANANANVFSYGTVFWNAGNKFTGAGAGRVVGSWTRGNPGTYTHRLPQLPEFADNAAAILGGLEVGDLYRTAVGVVMVRF